MFDGLDFVGITRAIDQAIYMLLNAVATMLWRLDASIIAMSLYSYSTQDWLTGTGLANVRVSAVGKSCEADSQSSPDHASIGIFIASADK